MAFKTTAANLLRDLATKLNPDSAVAEPLPTVRYAPANEPGGSGIANNQWYWAINAGDRKVGLVFICRCGQSNLYMFGSYNLLRELEKDHHCSARCASVVYKNGAPDQVRHVVDGLPVGAPHNLLTALPAEAKNLSEGERDRVYATLPFWRLVTAPRRPPFADTWKESGSSEVEWAGGKNYASDDNPFKNSLF